ncbi:TatD family hydrolase [Miniphocaeibacter massiliensis]|uniref:TatD family hydrolase n=1 Tax=Miniphocaeibacter massiliensis TaxID=2041841 RepID=UPI001A9368A9|nr:TatD family hydrolase [Miniphocaeibacter massiliensis]
MIDSHAHLDDEKFNYDRENIIKELKENQVAYVINPGADLESSKRAIELSKEYDFIFPAVGVHPHDAQSFSEEIYNEIKNMAIKDKAVAIGEIGLDYYYDNSPRDKQKEVFKKQLELARELNLPVIIHTRDAYGDTFDILNEFKGEVIGVMHCYSGSLEMAERYMSLGYYISFAGPVTFKNAKNVKETAENIPMDRLLIETDSPYLTPTPNRGKRNEPKYVKYVAETIAELKDVPVSDVIEASRENARNLFKLEGVSFED